MEQATMQTREILVHRLYEAAELEHNLMCTYLYAAFSLRDGEGEGLSAQEASAVARWRRQIIRVAVEEMGHLTAVWNITAALGGAPRFGRDNFPLNPGVLPAGVVVRLAPFNEATLQHFVHLERPDGSREPDGAGFEPELQYTEGLVAIAHACPSGAIRYRRKDGRPEEEAPPVNLIGVREAGPYSVRADIRLEGEALGYRATLCRCGASKNKPYCDGSHHDVHFSATGEPETGAADMLPVRDGPLAIDPQLDGPLRVRGNMEIISGTGRVVTRVTNALLCRCGGSANKPFCDGTHARIGFKSS
jgi:CDGSH-type Zn-finger protein